MDFFKGELSKYSKYEGDQIWTESGEGIVMLVFEEGLV